MHTLSPAIDLLRQAFETHRDEIIDSYKDFLRFASVSSDPTQNAQVHACADWVGNFLREMGFTTELWETSEHPVVFAQDLQAGPSKPTLLLYSHYDVQPVDPLELWDTPPFEPTVKDNTMFARGAQDNKGQCFYTLQAVKALKQQLNGTLPVNIKWVIEGNEETGSAGLAGILPSKSKALQADALFIIDVILREAHSPSVTLGLRGIVALEVCCRGSTSDLHSGCYGGIAYNPIHALVEILAKLRDAQGKITVPGFYDTVKEKSIDEKKLISFAFDPNQWEKEFGVIPTGGERALPPLERNWLRPTLEINGVTGGFSGPGVKTVIPAVASAKISCRLVPDQDPMQIAEAVTNYIQQLAPAGIEVTTHIVPGGGSAIFTDPNSTAVRAVARAFSEVFDKPCEFILEGASIPIVQQLQKACGGDVVLMGLGLTSDRIHAPNEHFGLARLQQGYLVIARALELLGASPSTK
jgi:acetylornithine deacetylase/succinyl-diaminopimelate desuccinylase-like protein